MIVQKGSVGWKPDLNQDQESLNNAFLKALSKVVFFKAQKKDISN